MRLVADGTYLGPQRITGLLITVLGLMTLTGAVGFRLGAGRRPGSAPAG